MGRSIVSEHARRCRSPQPRDTTVGPLGWAEPICRGGFRLAKVILVHVGSWVFRDSSGLSQLARARPQYLGRLIYRRVNVASTCLASELVDAAGVNRPGYLRCSLGRATRTGTGAPTLCLRRHTRPCGVVSGAGEEGAPPADGRHSSGAGRFGRRRNRAWWWRGLTRSWSSACRGPMSWTSTGMHDDLKSS